MAAIFSVIGTQIGNLEDVTLRALSTLRGAGLILCEDTRVTKRLLARHDIHRPTMSYHARSAISRTDHIVALIKEGKSIALVSDAGTPGISDPGAELVSRIRHDLAVELAAGSFKIEAVPGPSALTAALSIAGVPCADFTFLGFLPHKKGRETLFKEITASERTMIFYESPHRIIKTLESLEEHAGTSSPDGAKRSDGPKRVVVCRELTKIFEEVVAGTPVEILGYFSAHPDKVRGEFVVIVARS